MVGVKVAGWLEDGRVGGVRAGCCPDHEGDGGGGRGWAGRGGPWVCVAVTPAWGGVGGVGGDGWVGVGGVVGMGGGGGGGG